MCTQIILRKNTIFFIAIFSLATLQGIYTYTSRSAVYYLCATCVNTTFVLLMMLCESSWLWCYSIGIST